MSTRTRVLLVHNIMAPYRFPLFRALARHPDIDLTVWFMSRSARNRKWAEAKEDLGFDYEVLPSIELNHFSRDLFTYILNYSFPWRYARRRFDLMISAGWLDFASQAGFFASKALGRKFVLWSESTAFEPSLRRSLALPLVRAMVAGADACIGVGTRSREYLRALGAAEANLFTAFSTVDVELFRRVSAAARPTREQRKQTFGINRGRVLLYCGQFIERKGLRYLLAAFASIKQQYEDIALVLVGYGPARADLLAEVTRLGLSDVHIIDHVEVADMPKMYALADVFVLPSTEETWGLVINEAMACGLPVIVTDKVGSSVDLVGEGENGFVVPAGEAGGIAERALRLLKDDALLARMSGCSAERIQNFTPERAAAAFAAAVRHALRPVEG
jgi:glycosyltransferase involved in cell wall biosynthesis